jgi:MerR family transcriptional regulator, redox-sensitive transcriptional activator SoxR
MLPIGALARRTGLAVSAIRYYEAQGLIRAQRTRGNQRRFLRSDIRRLSFILIAQRLGLALADIEDALASLPPGKTPTQLDWQRVNRALRKQIDVRIQLLNRARNKLDECIGCGCLSLPRCQLYNRDDRAGIAGAGPRYVLN